MVTESKHMKQTVGEEITNAISHGVGALLAIAGLVIMLVYSAGIGSPISTVCAALYGASLIILYSCSCLYHAIQSEQAKKIFRIFDHCTIYFLIWGTYVPVALGLIGGALGWWIFGFQTACAAVGIALNAIDLQRFRRVSMVLYILMGWTVIVTGPRVFSQIDLMGIALLIGGGIAYTAGVLFYSTKKKYMHVIWHIFVIAGSALHFFFVLLYCLK